MIILFILIILSFGLCFLMERFDDVFAFEIGFALSALFLFVHLVAWPLSYFDSKNDAIIYQSTKATIQEMRKSNASEIERAAVANKVIEINNNIATAKYWNKTIFDCYIYDGFANLKPLK
jgi:hypothetical protein